MIKAVIERRVKEVNRLLPLLRELRAEAIRQPGHISAETLVGTDDASLIVVISTWDSLKDWQTWVKSEQRLRIERQIQLLLTEKPRISVYRYLSYPGGASL